MPGNDSSLLFGDFIGSSLPAASSNRLRPVATTRAGLESTCGACKTGQVAAALDVLLPNLLPELRGEVFEIAKLSADQIAFRFGPEARSLPANALGLDREMSRA